MKQICIEHISIIKRNAGKNQIEQLRKLTGSDKIKQNGKILTVCDFNGYYKDVKAEIAKIFNIKQSDIYLKYSEK